MPAILRRLGTLFRTEPDPRPKVICIGLNKTGTSTLKRCFETLGLGPVTSPKNSDRKGTRFVADITKRGDYEPALRYAIRYRSFEDRPWNVWEMYRHLDQRFTDSRFILSVRDPEDWWHSVHRWLTIEKQHRIDRYCRHLKAQSFDKDTFVAGFLAYNKSVREYFGSREEFLEINVCAGDGWESLCPFLGVPLRHDRFPHRNKQDYDDPRPQAERQALPDR